MDTLEELSQRIKTTADIRGVVRTMKSLSAVSIRQYERSMIAVREYRRCIEGGLQIVLKSYPNVLARDFAADGRHALIAFGSDRGLCGRFNERIAEQVAHEVDQIARNHHHLPPLVLVVGTRAAARLETLGIKADAHYSLPGSATGLTRVAQSILVHADEWRSKHGVEHLRVFYNQRRSDSPGTPTSRWLLPLHPEYLRQLMDRPWPSRCIATYRMASVDLFSWLVREHLLVSLIAAGTESLSSEHSSRLATMTAAEHNIDARLENLLASYSLQRQGAITAEILEVVSAVEAMGSGNVSM